MAGPSVKLGVTAAGVATIDGLNAALERLRGNLTALKVSKPDLGSLESLTAEFKRFRNEFTEIAQAQRTAFTELAETLKTGFGKAAASARAGAEDLDKALAKGGTDGKSGIPAFKAKMMVGAAQLVEAAEIAGTRQRDAMFAWKAKLMVGSAAVAEAQDVAAARAASAASAWQAKLQVGSLKIAEAIEAAEARESRAKLAWKAKMMVGSAAIAEGQELAATKAASAALGWQAKLQVGSLKIAEAIEAANAREQAAALAWRAKMMTGALKIAEEQDQAATKAASGALAWQARLQVGSLKIAEAMERAAQREQDARLAWIAKMQRGSLQIAEEQLAAAAREADALKQAADRIRKAEAAYQARDAGGQLRTQVRARAQLDAGRSREDVEATFGPTAAGAASAASSLQALKAAGQGANQVAADGTPKFKGMADAMRDGHSAARGLASGFNAMFLTWGNLGPLLAGAALSNAFVQTVKVGADVAHELAVVKILGEETAQSVGQLNEQLLEMARTGPFGPRQIAEAFKQLTLAGLSVAEQKTAINDVMNFAIAGTTTIDRAAQSMVQIATAFGYSANGFGRVGDVIAKAAAVSLSSVESLTQSMQSASEVHVLYGQSLVDVATNLALLSQLGIRGTAAGTALKNMYAELSGSTSIVRRNMIAWKIDALDPQSGKIKELLPLIEQLAGKYNSLKGPDQTRFIQDLSNTRGGKDLVALINAYNTMSKEQGQQGISQLAAIRKQIDESFGYQALAAARLGLTAKNQMASVASSFQASLASAFQGLEPAILSISTRLRETFGSPQFQANVQNLAVAVGNLGVYLVTHLDTIKNLAIAYLAWKAAMLTSNVFTAAAAGIASLTVAYRGLTAAKTADTVATEASAAAGATAALTGMGRLARFIPVVGGIIAGGILAWDLYWAAASGKKNNAQADALAANKALLANLQDQVKRTRDNWLALTGQKDASDQKAIQDSGRQALEGIETDLAAQAERVKKAQELLDRRMAGDKRNTSVENPYVAAARADLEAAKKSYSESLQLKQQITARLDELRDLSGRVSAAADAQANAPKPTGENVRPVKPEAAGSLASNLKSEYAEREKTLKEMYAFEQKLLDKSHEGKLISEAGYALRSQDLAQRQYDAELALLQDYKTRFETLRGQMAKEGKVSKGNAEAVAIDEMLKRLDLELVQRKKIADLKEQGAANRADRSLDSELEKLRQGVDLQERQMDAKLAYDRLLPEEQAALTARNAEAEKYVGLIQKAQLAISDLTRDIDKAAENDPIVPKLRARVAELEEDLRRIQEQRDVQSARAAQIATRSVAPQWKRDAEEWANTMRSMQKAYDDMITGVVQKGQDMWMKFVQTGKLSGRDLLNFIRDELAKQVYQQQLAPYFRDFGKMAAGFAYGQRKETSTGDFARNDRGQPQDNPFSNLATNAKRMFDDVRNAANPAVDGLRQLGSGAMDAVSALGSWIAQLLNSGGSISGLFSSIGSLFNGSGLGLGNFAGGGFGTGLGFGMEDLGLFLADGGAFKGGVQQYAKGDVFHRPTIFQFAKGGGMALGELGEAGPEAVMPLRRGPDGSLGVVAQGAGSGSNVSIVIENHGAQITQTETRKPNGEREMKLMVRAVVAEVNRQIVTGGSTAQAIKSQGVNMTGRLPRRN
jgi:TP901 family phage tail tape measure protein